MEHTLVMRCFGKDQPNRLIVVLVHIGDDHLGLVSLGLERLQEGTRLILAVVGIDVNVL